jgi:hypothetical protein
MNHFRVRLLLQFSASFVLILVFSSMNAYTLLLAAIGGGIMLLAFFSYYRPGAVFGLLFVSISAAWSVDVETLVEIGPIMTAFVGLMLPLAGLIMFALSSEVEIRSARRQKKPLLVSSAYGALCLLSVPITVVVLAAVLPNLTASFSGLTEAAIVLLFVSVGATLLTAREMKLK